MSGKEGERPSITTETLTELFVRAYDTLLVKINVCVVNFVTFSCYSIPVEVKSMTSRSELQYGYPVVDNHT